MDELIRYLTVDPTRRVRAMAVLPGEQFVFPRRSGQPFCLLVDTTATYEQVRFALAKLKLMESTCPSSSSSLV